MKLDYFHKLMYNFDFICCYFIERIQIMFDVFSHPNQKEYRSSPKNQGVQRCQKYIRKENVFNGTGNHVTIRIFPIKRKPLILHKWKYNEINKKHFVAVCAYHVAGIGNTNASLPISVVKYKKKEYMNLIPMIPIGITFTEVMLRISNHF